MRASVVPGQSQSTLACDQKYLRIQRLGGYCFIFSAPAEDPQCAKGLYTLPPRRESSQIGKASWRA